jgi:hypothetical protein
MSPPVERLDDLTPGERDAMTPPRLYRAFLSVPIMARSDADAVRQANLYTFRLLHPQSTCIAGHTELVFEEADGGRAARVVHRDLGFQVPPEAR